MLIATSLMYSQDEYEIQKQLKAMQTWKNMGFEVISCNVAEEIKLLRPFFQEINFVELARSGKEQTGKPFPYIYDILQALKHNCHNNKGEICGIINSDIFLKHLPIKALQSHFCSTPDTVLILHRYDIENELDTEGEYYFSGIDVFFFLNDYIDIFPDKGFMLGRPEWDHWFLGEAVKAGMKVREIKNKLAFHIKHKQRWTPSESNKMASKSRKKNICLSEKYYFETNEIMADLSNRIFLKSNVLTNRNELLIRNGCFYDDIERQNILQWEREVYEREEDVESVGLVYFKDSKVYRICALHREIVSNDQNKVNLGNIFPQERSKGSILRYVDFQQFDFVKNLGRAYIYPAGRAARLLLDCMDTYHIPVLGLVDRDRSLWGTECQGHRINSLEALANGDAFDHVLIATNLYVKEIYQSLKEIVDEEKLIVI